MPEPEDRESTRWLSTMLIDAAQFGAGPEQVRLALEAVNIESRPLWKPLHLQPLFAGKRRIGGQLCEQLFERGLCLPSGSNLRPEQRERVIEVIRSCHRDARPSVSVGVSVASSNEAGT
jgi:pyridoxal phosphate-dependent aminotransferase EpsN